MNNYVPPFYSVGMIWANVALINNTLFNKIVIKSRISRICDVFVIIAL